jgi:ATP-dependent DNA helicase RecQ
MGTRFSSSLFENFQLKTHFPKVPFLALTATATPRVKKTSSRARFKRTATFEKSFARKIFYMVFEVEDKLFRIEQILRKTPNPP